MQIPHELIEAVADQTIVPFVGSGVSIDVSSRHFCSWPTLLQKLMERIEDEDEKAGVRAKLKKGKLLEAAEEAYGLLQARVFREVIIKALGHAEPVGDLQLPKAIWSLGSQRVITTNYDRVLEWANPKSLAAVSSDAGNLHEFLNPKNRPVVWHLHGHVNSTDTLVLTKSQYELLYQAASEHGERTRSALQTVWSTCPLLFIGFGLRDDYVMKSLELMLKLFAGHARPRFVLWCQQDGTPPDIWGKYSIKPVYYLQHGAPLRQLLTEIRQQADQLRQAAGMPARTLAGSLPLISSDYRKWLESDCRDVMPFGMEQKQQLSVNLRQVYVPALVDRPAQPGKAESTEATEESEKQPAWQLLLEAVGQSSLLVEGDPGAGKSTFCRWLCLQVMCDLAPSETVETPQSFVEVVPDALRKELLAVRIPLRELQVPLCSTHRTQLNRDELEDLLGKCVDQYQHERGLSGAQVLQWLQAGRVLLTLDGVDEVPLEHGAEDARWEPRRVLLDALPGAVACWLKDGNRVMITSRPHGVDAVSRRRLENAGLRYTQLQPLPTELQDLLAQRWFVVVEQSKERGLAVADSMLRQVLSLERVRELVENPLLLTAICIIYSEGKVLPQDLHSLYDRIIDTSLHAKYSTVKSEVLRQRGRLVAIARGMHLGFEEGQTSPKFELHQDVLVRILEDHEGRNPVREKQRLTALQTLDDLLNRSGLLRSKSEKTAEFAHASFQEFLAAEALGQQFEGDDVLTPFQKYGDVSNWRQTLQFLFRRVAVNGRASAEKLALQIVNSLQPDSLDQQIGLAVVACDVVENVLDRNWVPAQPLRDQFTLLFQAALRTGCSERLRVRLALLQGRLGDTRPELDLLKPDAWKTVAAGPFFYGEQNALQELSAAFEIGRFPVTNAQFRQFVDAGGYAEKSFWSATGWAWRKRNHRGSLQLSRFSGPTQPVVSVSFWEAEAFSHWMSGRDGRYRYFLPAEDQWEAAARGGDQRRFPWGPAWNAQFCNSEHRIGTTTPVGIYPAGAAVCGAEDLAGNVWEWTSSHSDVSKAQDPTAARVLRGGGWDFNSNYCSAWFRVHSTPWDQGLIIGFRLARTLLPDG